MHLEPDPDLVRKGRWQRLLLLAVVNALVFAVALVATVDLRRLQTPGGTALRWVQAAVFGDCDDYLEFSLPAPDVKDPRSPNELCTDLRQATAKARAEQFRIGLHLTGVTEAVSTATAQVSLTRDGIPTRMEVSLVRSGGRWRVLRDAATCGSVGCA